MGFGINGKKMEYKVEARASDGSWELVRKDIPDFSVASNVCSSLAFLKKEARIVRVIEELIASPLVANYHGA